MRSGDELNNDERLFMDHLDRLLMRNGPDHGNVVAEAPSMTVYPSSRHHWMRRARRLAVAWNCLRGIPTADLERIAAAPGDAARLAQLASAADEAHQRAKEPK